jgi:nitroreductase
MELFETIQTRRSVRKFSDREVPEELIEKLLRAAMLAPSAGNQQPWHFIVIRDRKKLDEVTGYHPYCKMITQVSVALLICGDPTGKKWPDFWVQDCSGAIQNLLLAARALGLGTVWTGVYPVEDRVAGCRETFGLPEHIIPLAIIPVGWPDGEPFKETDRFKPELVHRDVFGA